jgi:acetoin utilization protein AcuB
MKGMMTSKPHATIDAQHAATLTVRQVMTRAPHTIGKEQTLAHAHEVMRAHALRHLPVLEAGKLVGVLSQRDLYFLETIHDVDTTIDVVADAMAPDVYSVGPEEKLRDVVRQMGTHRYGCAVVVDRAHVIGIFTVTDAVALLAEVLT